MNHGEKIIHPTLFGCDACGEERWKCKIVHDMWKKGWQLKR
jgi:hypothetical protein